MTDKPMRISFGNSIANRVLIELQGFLSAQVGAQFQKLIEVIKGQPQKPVLIDFSGVESIDGSGLIQLAVFLTQLKNIAGSIAGYGLAEPMREIFAFSHIQDLVLIFPDEKAALTGVYEER